MQRICIKCGAGYRCKWRERRSFACLEKIELPIRKSVLCVSAFAPGREIHDESSKIVL